MMWNIHQIEESNSYEFLQEINLGGLTESGGVSIQLRNNLFQIYSKGTSLQWNTGA